MVEAEAIAAPVVEEASNEEKVFDGLNVAVVLLTLLPLAGEVAIGARLLLPVAERALLAVGRPAAKLVERALPLAQRVAETLRGLRNLRNAIQERNSSWKLGTHKSTTKWNNQLAKRGWTEEEITNTIERGEVHPAPNKVNPANTATRYQLEDRFVVRDDNTKEILQISGENFKFNE